MHKPKVSHVCNVEFSAAQPARSKEFYSELFGWKIEPENKKASSAYHQIFFQEETKKEHLLGGLLKASNPAQRILVYIGVSPIEEYSNHVVHLRGCVLMPKTEVPMQRYLVVCLDTENNPFALREEDINAK
jgi:uncharacterized protein